MSTLNDGEHGPTRGGIIITMAKAIDDLLHVYPFCGRCIRSSDGQSMNVTGSSPVGCNLIFSGGENGT